jgi:hypothetical protein
VRVRRGDLRALGLATLGTRDDLGLGLSAPRGARATVRWDCSTTAGILRPSTLNGRLEGVSLTSARRDPSCIVELYHRVQCARLNRALLSNCIVEPGAGG